MPHTIAIDARKIRDFGIGTYVRSLLLGLAAIDQEDRFLILGRHEDSQLIDLPENFSWLSEQSPVYSLREFGAISWQLWRKKVDLYHATHYVLPALLPCRSVVTIHDIIHLLYPEFLPNRLALRYARYMIRRSLMKGDRIIAVSKNTRDDILDYFELATRKIEVVYNGVDDVYRKRLSRDEINRWLKTLELPSQYLLFVGNPKPHKNLDNVVKAYAMARKIEAFEAPLVCVGAREGTDFKLRQRANQLGIGADLRLLGHVAREALPAIYQGASLFLYPTLYEGFGLPVVEAMASGVPVITSNTTALKEIAEGYAHLVPPIEVEAIARAIAHCMANPEHRAALAKLGTRRAQDFEWKRTAQKTLDLYREALALPR